MDIEETSKLWTAFQAHYRPSAAYQISVVLIERKRPARSALPVLTIGPWDPALKRPAGVAVRPDLLPPIPTLIDALPPNQQPAIRMGEILTLEGYRLTDGPGTVRFTNTRTAETIELPAAAGATEAALPVQLPAASDAWRAGFYTVVAAIGAGPAARVTNAVPAVLAPTITGMAKAGGGVATTLTMTCAPKVWKDQRVSCIIADRELFPQAPAPADPDPLDQLVFAFDETVFAGLTPWIRLRVDEVDSLLIDRSTIPPTFTDLAPL
jgi:hypothetical protein